MRGITEINLSNLKYNFDLFRMKMPKSEKIAAVVKADAYGHGLNEVVRALDGRADYFIAATAEEAITVREITKTPVLCLLPLCGKEIAAACLMKIDMVVSSEEGLEEIICQSENMRIPAYVHMCVDTGMNRMGIKSEKLAYKLINIIKLHKNIRLKGIFSHFFDAGNTERRDVQVEKFKRFLQIVQGAGYKNVIPHIAATEACSCSTALFSMARVGIGLYGYGFSGMKSCMTVKSYVQRVEKVKRGEFVGYNGRFRAENDCFVATISAGYGDGILRSFSGGEVIINGKRRKIIGNVCMDYCFAIAGFETEVGDEVVFIGEQDGEKLTAEDMARVCGTISYEILTGIKRFEKKYIK